jgi:hypothetical protein
MKLTELGEARVRGYLYILGRSLRSFLPHDVALDSVREVESHIRERIAGEEGAPDELRAVARILAEVGPPLEVAQAYSAEAVIDEALSTGGSARRRAPSGASLPPPRRDSSPGSPCSQAISWGPRSFSPRR